MAKRSYNLLSRASKLLSTTPATCSRFYHVSCVAVAGQKWRMSKGMSRSGNEYGPLTDLPDWTFVDGRPPVEGKGQARRKVKQLAFGKRIKRLLEEMDLAKTPESISDSSESDSETSSETSESDSETLETDSEKVETETPN